MILLTNSTVARGWQQSTMIKEGGVRGYAQTPYMMLDLEARDDLAEDFNFDNHSEAIEKRLNTLADARREYPESSVGFYGAGWCNQAARASLAAASYRALVSAADYIAPIFYDRDDDLMARAMILRDVIDKMHLRQMKVICLISPEYQLLPESSHLYGRPIDPSMYKRQMDAVQSIGADGVYCWFYVEYLRWAAGLNATPGTQAEINVMRARATLASHYGLHPKTWGQQDVDNSVWGWTSKCLGGFRAALL